MEGANDDVNETIDGTSNSAVIQVVRSFLERHDHRTVINLSNRSLLIGERETLEIESVSLARYVGWLVT